MGDNHMILILALTITAIIFLAWAWRLSRAAAITKSAMARRPWDWEEELDPGH